MLYIHQFPDWTHFRFDARKVVNALGEARLQEGRLIGTMETCGFWELEQSLLVQDIVSNYAIDGISISSESVLKDLKQLQNSGNSMVRNYMGALLNAFNPITKERLFAWHASMGDNRVASFRQKANTVRFQQGDMLLEFDGPNPERLEQEMERLIQWIETAKMDGVIKAAIAHFWFITLRPFDDANGKLARLITVLMLARSEQTTRCQFALNQAILERREDYFKILNESQRGNGDLTEWILWFIDSLLYAMESTQKQIAQEQRRVAFYNNHAGEALDEKDQKLLAALFAGNLPRNFTAKEVAALVGASHDTALRTIQRLISKGILKADSKGGRSQRYSLA